MVKENSITSLRAAKMFECKIVCDAVPDSFPITLKLGIVVTGRLLLEKPKSHVGN